VIAACNSEINGVRHSINNSGLRYLGIIHALNENLDDMELDVIKMQLKINKPRRVNQATQIHRLPVQTRPVCILINLKRKRK
jgi:hypothetical protein